MRGRWTLWLVAGIIALPWARGDDEDGPGRGVARLSVVQGDVSVRRGDSGDWVAGAVNAPLVVQDRVITGVASRAEVQFDWANMVRLSSDTEIRLAELEYRRYQVQLARGTVMLRVLRDTDAEIEVNTPDVSVRPLRKGSYRVTVRGDESEITVRSGEAEIYTTSGSERLRAGRTMLVRGAGAGPEFRTVAAIPRDRFDEWNESRDRYLERTRAYRYVSPDISGADELDYHGRWVWVAPYGWVWTPWGVAAWWAPYRYGRWVWIDWYGWTWLSYDPWGWAPFHYGRWFWHPPYGWCWYPGPRHHRHYWRPALVAFFGFHVGGVHVGVGFGRIGWVPLAPYEPYYPWYGPRYYRGYRHPTYIDNSVRIVNNIQIVNVYRNARITNAISGVDTDGFVRGGRVQSLRVSEADWRNARLVQGPVPVVPAAESVRFADLPVRIPSLARGGERERFFSRRPAPAIERVPFEEQRRGIEHIVRRAFGAETGLVTSVRPADPVRSGDPVRGVARQTEAAAGEPGGSAAGRRGAEGIRIWRAESGGMGEPGEGLGWRHLGDPARTTPPPAAAETGVGSATDVRGGWRRIGEPARAEQGNLSRIEGGETGQWQRFGVGNPGENRYVPGARGIRRAPEDRNWRRLGEPVRSEQAPALTVEGGEGNPWQRFGAGNPAANRNLPGVRDPGRAGEDHGWRRLGEPARTQPESLPRIEGGETSPWQQFGAGGARETTGSGMSGGLGADRGWRRFGEPIPRDRSPIWRDPEAGVPAGRLERAPAEPGPGRESPPIRREAGEGWRRFSAPRMESPGRDTGPAEPAPRWSAPSWRSESRPAEPGGSEIRRGAPIYINPPIVRERSAPRWDGGPRWSGGEIRGDAARGTGEIRGGSIRGEGRGGEIRGGGVMRSGEGGSRVGRPGGPR